MTRAVLLSVALVACGRIGFDKVPRSADAAPHDDGMTGDAPPVCTYQASCGMDNDTCCDSTGNTCIPEGGACAGTVARCLIDTNLGCSGTQWCCQTGTNVATCFAYPPPC